MAATYSGSMKMLEPIEGGYAKAYDAAGETYRGIDRKWQAGWKGWPLIDAYKRKYGVPQIGSYIIDPALNAAVAEFYNNYWNAAGMNNLNNPVLAAMVWALIVHRGPARGVNQVNLEAAKWGATQFGKTVITANVAAAMESNLPRSYAAFRQRLIDYYNAFPDKKKQAYINNRVLVFPAQLPGYGGTPATNAHAPAPTNTNNGDTLKAAGILATLLKFIF